MSEGWIVYLYLLAGDVVSDELLASFNCIVRRRVTSFKDELGRAVFVKTSLRFLRRAIATVILS